MWHLMKIMSLDVTQCTRLPVCVQGIANNSQPGLLTGASTIGPMAASSCCALSQQTSPTSHIKAPSKTHCSIKVKPKATQSRTTLYCGRSMSFGNSPSGHVSRTLVMPSGACVSHFQRHRSVRSRKQPTVRKLSFFSPQHCQYDGRIFSEEKSH